MWSNSRSRFRVTVCAVIVLIALAACRNQEPIVQIPATAVLVGGPLTGAAGQSITVTVQVKDTAGAVVPGVAIHFIASFGTGTLSASQDTTDGNGQASTVWKLGAEGGTQNIEVRLWPSLILLGAFTLNAAKP